MKIPTWNAKITLDKISKNYQILEKSQAYSTNAAVVPHAIIRVGKGSLDTFCYIGCKRAGLSTWACLNWCGSSVIQPRN